MKKLTILFTALFLLLFVMAFLVLREEFREEEKVGITLINYSKKSDQNISPKSDHSQYEVLQKEFTNANEVTETCLSCHNQRGEEIMKTSHWKWQREEEIEGKGVLPLGKKNILNNFCIGVSGSEATCTRCHIGYGWEDKNFDFSNQNNIDCLVCHDKTGSYEKEKGAAGYPKESVDLSFVAQNVGSPGRSNCGVCHYWGGGGNNVKHGDLDEAMNECDRYVDVHMAADGENMSCVECHVTENHQMAGKLYALSSENKNRLSCEQCHTEDPHESKILNEHNCRVACQTCHIPVYAKANPTKMIWDWSTSGKLDENGHATHENDADGNHKYLSIKGTFIWDDNVIPEYFWFNGIANHQLITDKIDTIPVQMNTLDGTYQDKGDCQKSFKPSKIWPVKVHRGKQIYDPVNMTLIQPKLWDQEEGKGAYWKDFDWNTANKLGMDYLGLPYSGEYDFIETEMYWPLNHQVSPVEYSLTCIDCHDRNNSRLEKLDNFYLPGRDYKAGIEIAGIGLIILSIITIIVHTILRIINRKKYRLSNLTTKK